MYVIAQRGDRLRDDVRRREPGRQSGLQRVHRPLSQSGQGHRLQRGSPPDQSLRTHTERLEV